MQLIKPSEWISSVIGQLLLVEPMAGRSFVMGLLSSMKNGEVFAPLNEKEQFKSTIQADYDHPEYEDFGWYWLRCIDPATRKKHLIDSYSDAPAGVYALHKIDGVMLYRDHWKGCGSETLRKMIVSAEKSSNVIGHFFEVSSPGGESPGIEALCKTIAELQKPNVVLAKNVMASAALYSVLGANRIFAEGYSTMIGSIGTMYSIVDETPFWKEMGLVFHDFKADASSEKGKDYEEMLKGNYRPMIEERLNPQNLLFMDAVNELLGLGLSYTEKEAPEPLNGKVYQAEEALSYKLVHQIGGEEDAFDFLDRLTQSNSNAMSLFGKKYPALNNLAAKGATAVSQEEIDQINQELQTAGLGLLQVLPASQVERLVTAEAIETANTQLQADLKTQKEEVTRLSQVVSEKESLITQKDAALSQKDQEIAALKKTPFHQAGETPGKSEGEDHGEENDWQKELDALPHNQKADQLFG